MDALTRERFGLVDRDQELLLAAVRRARARLERVRSRVAAADARALASAIRDLDEAEERARW